MAKNKFSWTTLRRSPYQSLAAFVLTTVTFFVVSLFALVTYAAHTLLQYFESRPQVTAYFLDTADQSVVTQLETTIREAVPVESVQYISKEEALAIYQAQNASDPLLLEMVTADILPASLEVSAKNADDLEKIASLMHDSSAVEEVAFQKDVIDQLRAWVTGARIGGAVLSSILLLTSFLTIIIILGMKFATKKPEIKTLSLLGASRWYIKKPFIVEGLVYATVGALLGWGVSYTIFLYLTPNLAAFFQPIPLFPLNPYLMLILLSLELLLGTILGAAASLIATRRFDQ